MKKLMVLVMFLFVAFSVFAQDKISVGLWVVVNDDAYRTRVINEVTSEFHNSEEWPFEVKLREWDTDVHVILSGIKINDIPRYAWGLTYTPIHNPIHTNGTTAVSEDSISGMNWISRETVVYIEEQLYLLMDALSEGDV